MCLKLIVTLFETQTLKIKDRLCVLKLPHLNRSMTKPTKWQVCVAKTTISLGIRQVWSVLAVHMKKGWVLSYPLSAQRRLIRLGRCPGWSESSLGAQSFCWFCHEAAHLCLVSPTWGPRKTTTYIRHSRICCLIRGILPFIQDFLWKMIKRRKTPLKCQMHSFNRQS